MTPESKNFEIFNDLLYIIKGCLLTMFIFLYQFLGAKAPLEIVSVSGWVMKKFKISSINVLSKNLVTGSSGMLSSVRGVTGEVIG